MRKIITTLFIIFFNIAFSYAQTYFLPDTNFVNAIKTKYPTLLRNDSLLTENAKKITGWVDFQSKNLYNIDGIQFFNTFTVDNLPGGFGDVFFAVGEIEHSVSDGNWDTTIVGYMMINT